MSRFVALLAVSAVFASACGETTRTDVRRMEREVKWAKVELAAAQAAAAPLEEYAADLESGRTPDGYRLMISPLDIRKYGADAFIPYTFPAKSIHKKLGGTFTTKKIVDVEILHANRLRLTLLLEGDKIAVNYKGDLYKPHVKKIKAALEKGMVVDLKVALDLSEKTGAVVATARCSDVKLLAHNEDLYRDNVKSAVNAVLSKEKYTVPLPEKGALKAVSLFTTRNHVVVVYR